MLADLGRGRILGQRILTEAEVEVEAEAGGGDLFILAARKRSGVLSEGHSFLISSHATDLDKVN